MFCSGRRSSASSSVSKSRVINQSLVFSKCINSCTKAHTITMPQLISPLALRALRTLIQRPASVTSIRTLKTPTSLKLPQRPPLKTFTFQPVFRVTSAINASRRQFSNTSISRSTYNQVRRGCRKGQGARRARSPALKNRPELKGVVLKTGISRPKKPNSGERQTARVRLSSGKIVGAIIKGEGMHFCFFFYLL